MHTVPDWNLVRNRNRAKVDIKLLRFCFENLISSKVINKPQGF